MVSRVAGRVRDKCMPLASGGRTVLMLGTGGGAVAPVEEETTIAPRSSDQSFPPGRSSLPLYLH